MEKLVQKIDWLTHGMRFYLILVAILLVGTVMRTLYLDADPPIGISYSQDFSTDPFQYTYFAKNQVDLGDSNPYDDPRFTQWEKSTQNLLALIVYSLVGTGRSEGNLVGVIFNLLAILFLALGIKNFGSRLGALVFALIASLSYTLVFFARVPFLEASQNCLLCFSFYLFSKGDRNQVFYLLSGIACGAASLFGKMIALFMLGVYTLTWLYYYYQEKESRREIIKSAVFFYGGFVITALSWALYIYLPSRGEFSGYLSEQAVGLYGAPLAFDSLRNFLWYIFSLLWEQTFFAKLPAITILAFIAGATFFLPFITSGDRKKKKMELDKSLLILFLWFVVGYLALFPWNYRPLRYQTTLMFPMMALTSLALCYCFHYVKNFKTTSKHDKAGVDRKVNTPLLSILWGLWFMPLFGILTLWFRASENKLTVAKAIYNSIFGYAICFFVIGALLALLYKVIRLPKLKLAKIGVVVSTVLLLVILIGDAANYAEWCGLRQYTLITADRDLDAILNDGAVISGPYGPALTQENRHGAVMHMFGVKRVDQELFGKFPITHLAMDESNEDRARKDYRELMSQAKFVTRYFLRGVQVKVYRISEASPNSEASRYVPTNYEIAQNFTLQNNGDSAEIYFARFIEEEKPNLSCNLYLADAYLSTNSYEQALTFYQKARSFSPRDARIAFGVGHSYLGSSGIKNNPAYFDSALTYLSIAQKHFPDDTRLEQTVEQLERRKK